MSARVLIAGCGYVGTALGALLVRDGDVVSAVRRTPVSSEPGGIRWISADLGDAGTLGALPPALDAVFYTAAPDASTEESYRAAYVDGLRNVTSALQRNGELPRLLLTTSTAVYAQDRGEEVDESTPAEPVRFQGRVLLEAEQAAREATPLAVAVRFGGIYGPGRNRLIEQVRRGEAAVAAVPSYTNRIHRDDCAGVLRHLLRLDRPHAVYLGVDCDPADRADVVRWLARRLGAPQPPAQPASDSGGPAPAAFATGKRCSNARLRAGGYTFRFPTFREGYEDVLRGSGS